MIRKTSYANQSEQGATTQSMLMTIFRTLRLRNQQPIDTILRGPGHLQPNRPAAKTPNDSIRRLKGYPVH
ncbi:MAG: hypothetical protein ACK5Q5_08825, partial [Planctomycetaceae bacterium]